MAIRPLREVVDSGGYRRGAGAWPARSRAIGRTARRGRAVRVVIGRAPMTALIRIDRSNWSPAVDEEREKPVRFCSRCGVHAEGQAGGDTRVCHRCGMGMLLTTGRAAVPGEASAFAIFT